MSTSCLTPFSTRPALCPLYGTQSNHLPGARQRLGRRGNNYSDHSFTIARHPSEPEARMMVRLLAYVLNVPPSNDLGTLEFGKDMREADEHVLCQRDLICLLLHEIEFGQPEEKRLFRACGRAKKVTVYTYGVT